MKARLRYKKTENRAYLRGTKRHDLDHFIPAATATNPTKGARLSYAVTSVARSPTRTPIPERRSGFFAFRLYQYINRTSTKKTATKSTTTRKTPYQDMEAEMTYNEAYRCATCCTMSVTRNWHDRYYLMYKTESYILYECKKCGGTLSCTENEDYGTETIDVR